MVNLFRRGRGRRGSSSASLDPQTGEPSSSIVPTPAPDDAGPSHAAPHSHSPSPLPSPQLAARHSSAEMFDMREEIVPYGDSFENSVRVIHEINKIVNNYWRGDSLSYTSTPGPTKELWWNEFKRVFMWDPLYEMEIKRIFKKKCGDHIRHMLNHAKNRGKKPPCVTEENWTKITNFWESDASKERSQQNKTNQSYNSGEMSATYAGGSINIEEHTRRLSRELGRDPGFKELFSRTFKKKDKTWSGDRAKSVMDKYDQLELSQRSSCGSDDTQESDPSVGNTMNLWLEASGGPKGGSGRILGMGSTSRNYRVPRISSSTPPPAVTAQINSLTQEVSNLKGIILQRDDQIKERDEQMREREEQMRRRDRRRENQINSMRRQQEIIMKHFQLDFPSSEIPPDTGDDGDNDDDDGC